MNKMDKGLFGWLFSLMMVGAVVFAMVMSAREGRPAGSLIERRAERTIAVQTSAAATDDPVEKSLAQLRLLWAALDGAIDENEIADIARKWKNATEDKVLPVLHDLVRQIRAGRGEEMMRQSLERLAQESEPVRLRVLEEFGRMMQESGPLREQAAQLLALWGKRLLGEGVSQLWQRLGF